MKTTDRRHAHPAILRAARNGGMTYVELVVVLGIFSVLSAVILFNYDNFLSKVDTKVLANDIALQLVDGQKSAVGGQWNSLASSTWKPSYGVYFNLTSGANTGSKVFYSFADLDNNKKYDERFTCPGNECLERFSITKGDFISAINSVPLTGSSTPVTGPIAVTFTRPDSAASFCPTTGSCLSNVNYLEIVVSSPSGVTATIRAYASGRVDVQ